MEEIRKIEAPRKEGSKQHGGGKELLLSYILEHLKFQVYGKYDGRSWYISGCIERIIDRTVDLIQ